MNARTREALRSSSWSDHVYPVGTEVVVLEWLDKHTVIAELRAPDDGGGVWYEQMEVDCDQLDFEVVE